MTKYIPHCPLPKQQAFLWLTCHEAFYGGAAGGGKSDALLMAALQYVDVPGYAAILFRRTYKEATLPKAIMARAHEWLSGSDARWNDQRKTWTFPSGATLTFGYLDNDRDLDQYQSAELQFCGFDELTHFEEHHYTYLFSRLRRLKGVNIPIRMRAASNPGGVGHEWVKRRFIVEGRQNGRVFIPAWLEDNTHLDREEYETALRKLDPVTRLQLREGNWDVVSEGAMFHREWFEVVDAAPAGLKQVRYWDLAATEAKRGHDPDYTAGALVGVSPDGVYYILRIVRVRATPLDVEKLIRQTAEVDERRVPVWIEQEPGSSGKNTVDNYVRRVLVGFEVRGCRPTGSKAERARLWSAQAQAGNVKLVRGPWIGEFLDEVAMFPQVQHDDQVDAVSGAFEQLMGRRGGIRAVAGAPL